MSLLRRKRVFIYNIKWVKPVLILAGSIFFALFFFLCGSDFDHMKKIYALAGLGEEEWGEFIEQALPGYGAPGQGEAGWVALGRHFLFNITGIDARDPGALVGSALSLPFAGTVAAASASMAAEGGEEDFYLPGQDEDLGDWISIPEEQFGPVQLNGEPMILLYNTHNAESYRPSDGKAKLEGKNGGVAAVAKALSSAIEREHSIKTVCSDIIHDYPDWTKSYINSMKTVKQMLQKYDKIQMVIDIHRDAGLSARSDTLVKISGKNCAKVMIIVGKEHPRWRENLAFAERLEAQANKLFPGLIKCVRALEDRRYNQHLHPRALLLEFGSDLNTREDALNSAVLMAEVIARVLFKSD